MNTTIRCEMCGREAPPGARFCPGCGASLNTSQRPHTGAPVRPAAGDLPPQHILGKRFAITRKLAQGGQSAVYLAVDLLDGNGPRAIKEMTDTELTSDEREKAINDFYREAQLLNTLHHPSLARVYDLIRENHKHYLVMEYVPGHNLEDELLTVGRPLEWESVVGWGIALCDVLTYLHGQQPPIIYRDLKPSNVMLTPDGTLKLIDFGIARRLHPQRMHDTTQLGTDGYAPTEQYAARSEPRSDLYALGASLYHLLTGRVPESAPQRLAGRELTRIRAVNPRVPEALERAVLQALSLKADERFRNAAQMKMALQYVANPGAANGHLTGMPAPAVIHAGRGRATDPIIGQPSALRPTPTYGPAPTASGGPRQTNGLAQPHLHVWPLRLDAGFIESGMTAALLLEIGNRGGGTLQGRTETNLPSLIIEPSTIDARTTSLRVQINTLGLQLGPYTCHVAVRTNGGDQIIQVRFVVQPPSGQPRGRSQITGGGR